MRHELVDRFWIELGHAASRRRVRRSFKRYPQAHGEDAFQLAATAGDRLAERGESSARSMRTLLEAAPTTWARAGHVGRCRFRSCIRCIPCRVARCNTALFRVSDRTAEAWWVSLTTGLGVSYGKWNRTGSNRRPLACHNPAHVVQDALTTLERGFAYCKLCVHSAALREFAARCAVYTALRAAPRTPSR